MTVRVVTDSVSQIPEELAARLDIAVVPITLSVDGRTYTERIDLDVDTFYSFFDGGARPEITTSQPSPGDFLATYRRLVDEGATAIVSVHVTEQLSGTLNSARLAAAETEVPVHLVDSGTASFGIAVCAWAAAESAAAGGDVDAVVAAAEQRTRDVETVFVVGARDLARAGGRVDTTPLEGEGVAVLSYEQGELVVLGNVHTDEDAVSMMAAAMLGGEGDRRVAIALADADSAPVSEALEAAVRDHPEVVEIVRYRVGPSVGLHTGPGTAGGFWWPA